MAARLCGIALEAVAVDTQSEPDDLLRLNPLGKIPTLVLDDGSALYDSRTICDYLDRQSGNRIVPQDSAAWIEAKRIEATADGVVDAAMLVVYESRFRPDEKRHEPWVDRQWRKAERGLAVLERDLGPVPAEPTVGDVAVAAMAGWLSIRFPDRWDTNCPKLRAWTNGFFDAFADLDALRPSIPR